MKAGDVVGLVGDIGSGKTTFIQGLAEGIGVSSRVNSPTFIIMKQYNLINNHKSAITYFYHVDLYRLEVNLRDEVENLGLLDIILEGKSIVVIEWAERIKDMLPSKTRWLFFQNITENERKITL